MRAERVASARLAAALCAAAIALPGVARGAPAPAPAPASGIEGAKAAAVDGDRSFQLGRFDAAIEAYERAFSLDPQPAFLFNIGLAHRRQYQIDGKAEHLLRARELYRNYLKLDPASPRRAGVEKVLVELEAQIEDTRRNAAPPVPPPVATPTSPPPVAPPPPPAAAPPAPATTPALVVARPAEPAPPSSSRKWLLIGGAAVVIAAAIAVTAILIANRGSSFDGPGVDLTRR